MKLPVINNTILWIALAVLIVLQVKSCTDKVHKPEQMIRNEEKINYLEKDRIKDSIINVQQLQLKSDSIAALKEQFAATTPKLQQSKKDYEKIRPVINSLNDNELLQRANSFKPD